MTGSPETTRTPRRDLLVLVVLLLAGALVRAAYLGEVVDAPDYRYPVVDAWTHDYWARGLAFGDWTPPAGQPDPHIPTTPFFRPPAYPYLLAATYALSGGAPLAPRILQMFLGLCSAVLVFLIGRRWFGRLAALVAAAGMCLWWVLVYFEAELLAPPVLLTTLLAAVWCLGRWLERRKRRWLVTASVLLGLACLLRPTFLAFLPWVTVWAVLVHRRDATRSARSAWMLAAVLLLPAVGVVSAATLRNRVVAGETVLVSSNGGVNLFIGNNPRANGFAADELEGVGRFGTCFDWVRVVSSLERLLQHPVSHAEASRWFTQQALSWMRDHPGRAAFLMFKKACLLWGNAEIGNNKELSLERRNSSVLRWLPGPFAVLASLAILGAIELWRRRRQHDIRLALLLAGCVVLLVGSTLPFFAAARFRVPVLPVLFLFAGFAVQRLVDILRTRDNRALVVWAATGIVLLAAHLALPFRAAPDAAAWHFTRGSAWLRSGNETAAAAEFRAALDIEPRHVQARTNLASLLARRTDDPSRSIALLREALQQRPDAAPVLASLGAALLVQGQVDSALVYLRRAVQREPDVAETHANLSRALQQSGDGAAAIEHMQRAATLEPTNRDRWMALAGMALAEGDRARMLEGWQRARQMQDDPALDNNLAWVYATHPQETVRDGAQALRLATAACEATRYAVRPYLDTLAAAQAEVGDFDAAVATTERSLSMARAAGDAALVARLQSRRQLYATREPYRDASLP